MKSLILVCRIFFSVFIRKIFGRSGPEYRLIFVNPEYFGHFVADPCLKTCHLNEVNAVILLTSQSISNSFIYDSYLMAGNVVIHYSRINRKLERLFNLVPKKISLTWFGYEFWGAAREFQAMHRLRERRSCLLDFKSTDGDQIFADFELEKGSYVVVSFRDSYYHRNLPNQDAEAYRNKDIGDFFWLFRRFPDVKFVRLGKCQPLLDMPDNVVDYPAWSGRSAKTDIVLIKNALGLVSSGDGVASVANIFDVPVLLFDYYPYEFAVNHSLKNHILPRPVFDADGCLVPLSRVCELNGGFLGAERIKALDLFLGASCEESCVLALDGFIKAQLGLNVNTLNFFDHLGSRSLESTPLKSVIRPECSIRKSIFESRYLGLEA